MITPTFPVDLTPNRRVPASLQGAYSIEIKMVCTECEYEYAMSYVYAVRMLAHQELWPCCCGQAMDLMCAATGMEVGQA